MGYKTILHIGFFMMLTLMFSCGDAKKNKPSADDTVCGYYIQLTDSDRTKTHITKTYWFYEKNHRYLDFSLYVTEHNNGHVSLITNYRKYDISNTTDKKVNFDEQISIINSFILKKHKEKIMRVKSINIPLLFAADINGEVAKKFCNGKGGRGKLEEIVQKSKMGQALDSIFSPYGLYVKKVCIEKFYLTDKAIVKEQNIPVSDYTKLPNNLVYGSAGFILAKRR